MLLARLFTKPANMMVLDEPTNDLDVDTLELLEDLLEEYEGTLLLVSHDRAFLDNVVTSTIVFEGDGKFEEYVGGYEDMLRQRKAAIQAKNIQEETKIAPQIEQTKQQGKKLSYKETRELEQLPHIIEQLENEQHQLQQQISSSEFYQLEKDEITDTLAQVETVNKELEQAFERWEYLDGK